MDHVCILISQLSTQILTGGDVFAPFSMVFMYKTLYIDATYTDSCLINMQIVQIVTTSESASEKAASVCEKCVRD